MQAATAAVDARAAHPRRPRPPAGSDRCSTRPRAQRDQARTRDPAARHPARRARHGRAGVRLRRRHRAAPAGDRAGPAPRPRHARRRRVLLRELGVLVLVGTVLGAALGWLVAIGRGRAVAAARRRLEARWPVLGGGRWPRWSPACSPILAAGAPTLRQPLTSLLRRVPPRASTLQVGLVEGAVVAAAAAGVVDRCSPATAARSRLLAPGLLAIAGGLLLAQATIPTAGPLARRALRRGRRRSAPGRPADRPPPGPAPADRHHHRGLRAARLRRRRLGVADRNRTTRAEVEAGAPVVLTVDADSSPALRRPCSTSTRGGRFATPVVTVSLGDRDRSAHHRGRAGRVRPDRAVGPHDGQPTPSELAQISPPRPAPIEVRGDRVEVDASFDVPRPPALRGRPGAAARPDPPQPRRSATPTGVIRPVDLGRLREGATPTARPSTARRAATSTRCRQPHVRRLRRRPASSSMSTRCAPGPRATWRPVDLDNDRARRLGVAALARGRLRRRLRGRRARPLKLSGTSFGVPVAAAARRPAGHPVALSPATCPSSPFAPTGLGPRRSRPGPRHRRRRRSRSSAERAAGPALRDRGRARRPRRAATPARPPTAQTSYDVWLAADDPARAKPARAPASPTTGCWSRPATRPAPRGRLRQRRPDPGAAARAARRAGRVVLGAAVLVVGVATSGASRARDLAGLRLVGVPAATVRSASVREHLVVAVLGRAGRRRRSAWSPRRPRCPTCRCSPASAPAAAGARPGLGGGARHRARPASCCSARCRWSSVVPLAASAVPARLREGR